MSAHAVPHFGPSALLALGAASSLSAVVSALFGWPAGVTAGAVLFGYWNLIDRSRRVQAALLQDAWHRYEAENVAWRLRQLPPGETRAEGFRRLSMWLDDAGLDTARPARELLLLAEEGNTSANLCGSVSPDEHAPGAVPARPLPPSSVAPGRGEIEPGAPTLALPPDDEAPTAGGSEPSSPGERTLPRTVRISAAEEAPPRGNPSS